MNTEIEEKYRKAVNMANSAKTDEKFSEAIALLMEISDVYPKAAYEVFVVFKRCGYTEQAYFYLQLAAVQGYENARVKLGKCLAEGIYFEKNEQEAVKILSEYSENAAALCGLGYVYILAEQIPKDYQKAVQCFVKSAGMGYAQASYNIAVLCSGKIGLERNEKQMFDWLNTAMSQGSADACYYAAYEYYSLGKINNALGCLHKGMQLGHKGCADLYWQLSGQTARKSTAYQSGIYQSEENEAEFSYTGQSDIVYEAEVRRAQEINNRRKAMEAAAVYSGGGFVNYETGFTVDRNGNTIVTDETGFSYSEKMGSMLYDKDTQFLFTNKGTAYFDENMEYMYDNQRAKWSMIIKI